MIAETIEEWFKIMDDYFEGAQLVPKYWCHEGKIYDPIGNVVSDPNKYYNSSLEFWEELTEAHRKEVEKNNGV